MPDMTSPVDETCPPAPPVDGGKDGGGEDRTKLVVYLYPEAYEALEKAAELERQHRPTPEPATQAVNRALQMYAHIQALFDAGCRFEYVDPAGDLYEISPVQ